MRNDKQQKMHNRRASRFWRQGHKDGMSGIKANPKLIPRKYRHAYDQGHTAGMVDSGAFINIHPLEKVS